MKRAKFNLGHTNLLTCDMGYLIPISCVDVICGDRIKAGSQAFIRLSPMLAPIMHPIDVRIHHWFVPYRLIWDNFEAFICKNEEIEHPYIEFNSNETGSLADYLSVPTFTKMEKATDEPIKINALPFRAYNLIWNKFYRDQDLQDELPISFEDGKDNETSVNLQKIAWQKDYFTLARPWEQTGEEVQIPIRTLSGEQKPSTYKSYIFQASYSGSSNSCSTEAYTEIFKNAVSSRDWSDIFNASVGYSFTINVEGTTWTCKLTSIADKTGIATAGVYSVPTLKCNLSEYGHFVTPQSFTFEYRLSSTIDGGYLNISDIRAGIAEQRLRERKARFGSEYRDLLASYGIRYSDSRLQLPEYLAGGKSLLQISEVIQTAPSETLGNVGDMKGHGIGIAKSNRFIRSFTEHGVILSLLSVLPRTVYCDGIPRYLMKQDPDDYYQREIAQLIPHQEIYQRELHYASDEGVIFGYQDRYDEYRHGYSQIHGQFRDMDDYWHLARRFEEPPVLNGTFVQCNPTKRIFAEQTTHSMYVMAMNMIRARRILPKVAKSGAL